MRNVRKALLEREWLEVRDDGAVLVQPGALLRTWRATPEMNHCCEWLDENKCPIDGLLCGFAQFPQSHE